ncbi:coiled-coil domain-containing protein 33 isoform X5 [Salvelinus fontinalis]|uniref:coiled-coil domain-containing protein 33 isoform X5 n=1 Tax=Salvelinus fontinalis TaxID=8038 RepID=UPI002484E066|nr:coiled-coil domain-containing protein 33 isoform X5 [Salvelinus fontinalis]
MKRCYRPCSSTKDGPSLPSYDALARILPDGPSLPSYDALARILPDNTPPAGKTEGPQSNGHINQTYQKQNLHKRAPLPDFEDDLQNKEVENYRTAMRKMADDVIALRTQVVTLGTDNSQLRSDLTLHQDLGRHLLDDVDVGVMTKAEIADRIASLKFKLASESSKASAQRDKIHQLQNDLIRKNDSEKELLRLQRAHQQQQTVLQRYHRTVSKTAGLETTVKQQEKIIEKMEKLLDNTLTEKSKDNAERMVKMKPTVGEEDNRKETATAAENSRLRGELDKIRSQPPQAAITIQQPAQQVFPDRERLSLLIKLEKAETRVRTLEKQLEDNSKRWGRQKQDMLTRLSEHLYGLDRTSSTIAHDLPPKSVSDSVLERTRQRELKPVKK